MIAKISNNLASRIVELGIGDRKNLVWYAYRLELLVGSVLMYSSISLLAIFSKTIIPTSIYLIFLFSLRKSAGGVHACSHLRCYIYSLMLYALGMTLFGSLIILVPTIGYLIALFDLVVTFLLAPIIHPNMYAEKKHKVKMRRVSIFIIILQSIAFCAMLFLNIPIEFFAFAVTGQFTAVVLLVLAKILKQEVVFDEEDL